MKVQLRDGKINNLILDGDKDSVLSTVLTIIRYDLSQGFNWKNKSDKERNHMVSDIYYKLLNGDTINTVIVTNDSDLHMYMKIIEE